MSTIRVVKRDHFTMIDNRTVRDDQLSFRARGILAWLLSQPDDWRCDSDTIARAGSEGRDAVRTGLRELRDAGYIVQEKEQMPDGKWRTRADVYERPVTEDGKPGVGKPGVGKPAVGKPAVGKPGAIRKNMTNEQTNIISSSPAAPTLELVIAEHTEPDRFDEFWKLYGNLAGTGPKKAKECWNTAMKRGDDPKVIIAGLEAWVAYWRTPGANKAMYAQGFLNQQKWATEPPPLHADKRTATQVGNDMANGIVKEETLQFIETLAAIGETK